MAFLRWRFTDDSTGEQYTVPLNPREMDKLFREKNVSTRTTTAIDGQAILFEGNRGVGQWTFSGVILDHQHYADLERWAKKGTRVTIRDHVGRTFKVYITDFDAKPKRATNRLWKHEYTMTCLLLTDPTPATVLA